MPKNKKGIDNKYLKNIEGEWAENAFSLHNEFVVMDLISFFSDYDKEFHNEYVDVRNKYNETLYTDNDENRKPLLRDVGGTIVPKDSGGDIDLMNKLESLQRKAKQMFQEIKQSEGAENFKDYLDIIDNDTNYLPGEYADAYTDSMYLNQLVDFIGSGPKLKLMIKDVVDESGKTGKVVDFTGVEEALRKPDGSGYFVPYMGMCKALKRLWELDIQRVRNDKTGWTPEAEDAFLKDYREANLLLTTNFEKLRKVVLDNPGLYDEYMDNHPEHMVDYARDHNKEYGFMKGQIKAIDNGWGIDELPLLGIVEEISHLAELELKKITKKRDDSQKKLAQLEEDIKSLPGDIEKLQGRRATDNYKEKLKTFDEENKDVIDAYKKYQEKIEVINSDKTIKNRFTDLRKLEEENRDVIDKYKEYEEYRNAMDYDKIMEQMQSRLNKAPDSKAEAEEYIKKCDETISDYNTLLAGMKELKDKVYDKKVSSLADKHAVFKEVEAFLNGTRNLLYTPENGGKRNEKRYRDHYDKSMELLKNSLEKGMTKDFANNTYAKERLNHILDIYGPNPKHDPNWETNKVISKADMEDAIKPYDTKGLPFSEKEMAFLGMAGTLTAKDEILAASNAGDKDFEDVLRTNYTKWMEDVSMNADGPREDFSRYRFVAAKGRENALSAMKKYVDGDATELCEIIYNGLINVSSSSDALRTYGDVCVHHYGMLSTFTEMLRKDATLREAFGKYNESKAPDKRVDFDKVYAIRNFAGLRMKAIDSEKSYKTLVNELKEVPDIKTLMEDEELDEDEKADAIDEAQKAKILRDEQDIKLALLERRARQGVIISDMFTAANDIISASPHIYAANAKFTADTIEAQKNGQSLEALTKAHEKFMRENVKLNPAFTYLGSAAGNAELESFADMLYDKYGISYTAEGLASDKDSVKSDPAYKAEINRFICQLANKQILKELKNNDLGKDKMKELASSYMLNNYRIYLLGMQIESGVAEPYVDFSLKTVGDNKDYHVAIEDSIKGFVNGMDMSDVSSAEFAKVLEGGAASLLDTAKNMEHLIIDRKWEGKNFREGIKFPSITDSVTALEEADRRVLFGSAEYKNILKDLKKLDEDLGKSEKEFLKEKDYTYNARELAHREKALINRLNAYIERKDEELKKQPENKKNQTSLSRRNAAEAVVRALSARLKVDSKAPTITASGREEAKTIEKYIELNFDDNYKFVDRKISEKPSGKEMLDASIEEQNYQRIKYAKMINKDNFEEVNTRQLKEAFLGTVKCALYYDMLKTAFTPKENDSDKLKAEKDAKLKLMMKKDVESSSFYKMIDKVMDTKFGKRFASQLFNEVTSPDISFEDYKGVFDHGTIIKIRDNVLKTCFEEEMDKYTVFLAESDRQLDKMYNEKNRRHDIKTKLDEISKVEDNISNLINLSDSIQSRALDDAKVTFHNVKQARLDRNAAREDARNERKAKAVQLRNKGVANQGEQKKGSVGNAAGDHKPKVQGPSNHM